VQIAEHRMLDPGLDAIDQVLIVDVSVEAVRLPRRRLLRRTPRQDGVRLAADPLRARRRGVRGGAFQEAPRRDPDLDLLRP
jgi:hypothetical protein